jgi:hypothetical protein
MKKFDMSRVAPLALSVALSLAVSFTVVDAIAALGMKAVASMGGLQPLGQPLLARSVQRGYTVGEG